MTFRDDHIFPVTRWVLAAVILVLLFAFAVLYLNPGTTKTNFAWEIKPELTAVFMGAGYISGAYMFVFAVFGKQWHTVKNSILPVSAFAAAMLLVTLLHLDRFRHGSFAFILWLVIYLITPILVPWLWFNNRRTDPVMPEANEKIVPPYIRWAFGLVGLVTLGYWVVNFIDPALLIAVWPWKLTPLTARVVCAWGTLVSVGGMVLFREQRWSAWRYNLQSIALWQALMVIGSIVHRQDFNNGSLINGYFIVILLVLVILFILYTWMELGMPGLGRVVRSPGSLS